MGGVAKEILIFANVLLCKVCGNMKLLDVMEIPNKTESAQGVLSKVVLQSCWVTYGRTRGYK